MKTKWGYVFSYRVHFCEDGYAEMSGAVHADEELSELDLQQVVLSDLDGHPDIPADVRPEDMVITRFGYVSMEPLEIPDVSQDAGQTAPAPDNDPSA